MTATDAQALALGYTLPSGTSKIRDGDDAIKANAKASAGLILDLQNGGKDTGWRNVNASAWLGTGNVPSRSSENIRIRRAGPIVTIGLDITWGATGTGHTEGGPVPVGFRPSVAGAAVATFATAEWSTGKPAGLFGVHYNGNVYCVGITATNRIICQLSWPTSDAWPTTLPGTPA